MIKLAFYGKGGIGKSTAASNVSVALAQKGLKVMQIGCDPKADSTIFLHGGERIPTVLDLVRKGESFDLEDMVRVGYNNVVCVEAGGPVPGLGCAGRGIITTFSLLEDLKLFEKYKPDVVLYDVLGDVVCGGFAAPIREGYASKVLIVTSGEKMALYAANNINSAVKNFADRSYAKVRGIVMNRRIVEGEEEKVRAFAESAGLDIVADIPRSDDIIRCEDKGMTVIEGEPDCQAAKCFLKLAQTLIQEDDDD
jgi:nitrogenase reductase